MLVSRNSFHTGFVEGNVTVRTDASQEQVDATDGFDFSFVRLAFLHKIWRVPIKDMCVVWFDVDELVPS